MVRTSLVREITVVIAVAVALGLLYNAKYNPKPIPWVHVERTVDSASTTEIDNILNTGSNNQTPPPVTNTSPSSIASKSESTIDSAAMKKMKADSIKMAKQHIKDSIAKAQTATQGTTQNPNETGAKLPPNNDLMKPEKEVKLPISVTYEQVLKLLQNATVQFIDARKATEFAQGHIGNAFNMDMVEANSDAAGMNKIMQHAYQISTDKPVVVYCGGGNCELSHELCDALIQRGLKKVFIYLGGWGEYSEKQGIKK